MFSHVNYACGRVCEVQLSKGREGLCLIVLNSGRDYNEVFAVPALMLRESAVPKPGENIGIGTNAKGKVVTFDLHEQGKGFYR